MAFVRTDGTHEIIRDITEVAPILNTNKEQFNNIFLGNNEKPNTPIKPTNAPVLVQKPANNTITETPAAPKVAPNKPKLTSEEKVKYSNNRLIIF